MCSAPFSSRLLFAETENESKGAVPAYPRIALLRLCLGPFYYQVLFWQSSDQQGSAMELSLPLWDYGLTTCVKRPTDLIPQTLALRRLLSISTSRRCFHCSLKSQAMSIDLSRSLR